jgi:hypothetical protein
VGVDAGRPLGVAGIVPGRGDVPDGLVGAQELLGVARLARPGAAEDEGAH